MIRRCPSCSSSNRIPSARLGEAARCGRCKAPLTPIAEPVAISTAADFDEIVRGSPLPVLVDFWADWCGPCRMVAPELEKLARAHAGRVVVLKVDTEALPEVASRYGIRSIPSFLRFDGGRETRRAAGAMPASALAAELGLGRAA
jgi:thioredoxin 2